MEKMERGRREGGKGRDYCVVLSWRLMDRTLFKVVTRQRDGLVGAGLVSAAELGVGRGRDGDGRAKGTGEEGLEVGGRVGVELGGLEDDLVRRGVTGVADLDLSRVNPELDGVGGQVTGDLVEAHEGGSLEDSGVDETGRGVDEEGAQSLASHGAFRVPVALVLCLELSGKGPAERACLNERQALELARDIGSSDLCFSLDHFVFVVCFGLLFVLAR